MPDEPERRPDHRPDREGRPGRAEPPDARDAARENPTRARAGQVLQAGLMRRVLAISLVLIIVAFGLIYLLFFIGEADEEATPAPEAPAEELEPPLPPAD